MRRWVAAGIAWWGMMSGSDGRELEEMTPHGKILVLFLFGLKRLNTANRAKSDGWIQRYSGGIYWNSNSGMCFFVTPLNYNVIT